jgi:hypothetical protein
MKQPAFQFYPAAWQGDYKLRCSSPEARCLWIEMMCIFHQSEPYGYMPNFLLNQIPSKTLTSIVEIAKRAPEDLLADCLPFVKQLAQMTAMQEEVAGRAWVELLRMEIVSVDDHGRMYSKRMVKDEYIRQVRGKSGKLGGNPALLALRETAHQSDLLNQNPTKGLSGRKTSGQAKGQAKAQTKVKQASNQKTTPVSVSVSSSVVPTDNTLVSFGDLSKPGVSTGLADQGQIDSVVQESTQEAIVDAFADAPVDTAKKDREAWPTCPQMEIIGLYHDLLPELPRVLVSRWNAAGILGKNLAARWRQGLESGRRVGFRLEECAFTNAAEGIAAFEHFFKIVQRSPLLLGLVQTDRNWRANLPWLMLPTNFEKVLQGSYVQSEPVAGGQRDTRGFAQRPSKLGTNGKPYDRFADFSTRGEFAKDDEVEDRRALKFDGSLYLLGEDVVILKGHDDDVLNELLPEYEDYGQVVEVPLEKLPKRVEIMRRCRINGLVNDAPDNVPILPEELPTFPEMKTPASDVDMESAQAATQ